MRMNRTLRVEVSVFRCLALTMMRKEVHSEAIFERRFRAMFGANLQVVTDLWCILPHVNDGEPRHMLWALLFLRVYNTEELNALITSCSEKCFRKWSHTYIRLNASAKIVRYTFPPQFT